MAQDVKKLPGGPVERRTTFSDENNKVGGNLDVSRTRVSSCMPESGFYCGNVCRILVPQIRIEPLLGAMNVPSPNHWTTRELRNVCDLWLRCSYLSKAILVCRICTRAIDPSAPLRSNFIQRSVLCQAECPMHKSGSFLLPLDTRFFSPWSLSKMLCGQHHQFSSVTQSCLTLCDPMDCNKPGLPAHHQLLEFTQTPVHWVGDAIQPFSSCFESFSASGSFQMSQFFASGSQSIGVSDSASVLPMNTQDWFPSGWTGWISLHYSISNFLAAVVHVFYPKSISNFKNLSLCSWPWKNARIRSSKP